MLWGYGPAVDILSEIADIKCLRDRDELNILIIGAADGRHILQTIAKYYKHPKQKVNFYVVEVMLDMIARQMLLLLTAFEPSDKLGLFEKTRLWMEIYGNTLMRPNSSKYIVRKAHQLIHLITDEAYLTFRLPLITINMMKYKERDNLETIFQFWAKNRFENVINLWDGRLRQSLGARYDAKEGVFDWDYYMRLKEVPEGARINVREYKHWRGTGVAFTWLESEVSEPNPTMASGVVKLGSRLLNHGYLGDIVSPPYLGFGTDSEDQQLLAVANEHHVHRSTDIVEANLRRLFHELETQTEYRQTTLSDKRLGAVITELTTVSEVPEREGSPVEEDEVHQKEENLGKKDDYTSIPVPDTKVIFLPTSALVDLPRRPSLTNFFDVVMISQNLTQRLSHEVMSMAKNGALLLAETRKFLTTSTNKEKQDFADYLCKVAEERQCQLIKPLDGVNDYLAKFRVVRK